VFYDDPSDQPFVEGPTDYDFIPDWFGNEITLQDVYGDLHSYTKDEWIQIALADTIDVNREYGYDGIDIMYALDELGELTYEDWEYWRAEYDATH
jgi:hypothetical protein